MSKKRHSLINSKDKSMQSCIAYYKRLLSDFKIQMSDEVLHIIEKLYPNEVAIESYIRTVILEHLE